MLHRPLRKVLALGDRLRTRITFDDDAFDAASAELDGKSHTDRAATDYDDFGGAPI
jgi:hypothetical protein